MTGNNAAMASPIRKQWPTLLQLRLLLRERLEAETMSIDAAIILAAGRGERLQPLTNTLAQALVPVAGRSLLERSIDRLNEHGVKNIVVNVHHLGHQIADRLNGRARIVNEECLLGTG